jgi:crotonobetainyl-CoA:carnitine CoA-transferase CaiB-like acyl-CoA transferase
LLAPILLEHDAATLSASLLDQGVPAGAILDVPAVLAAPHTRHRGMIAGVPGSEAIGIPVKFSRTPGNVRTAPGAFGERTREICHEAGLSDDQIDALLAKGVIYTAKDEN